MMEDFEDDFGDLYADIEAQATSAMNAVWDFAPVYTEPDEDNNDGNSNKMNGKLSSEDGFDSGPSRLNSNGNESTREENEDVNGSDSEDDLNIFLNDEDYKSKSFPMVGRGNMKSDEDCKGDRGTMKNDEDEDEDDMGAIKEFKCLRTHRSSIPGAVKAIGSTSVLVSGDWSHSVRGQHNGPISGQAALVGATPDLVMTQSRCGFSLPWYRSILDVNIDSFEEKPWRYPGVDITDFFNFGFNEDSWKQYCDSLEQLRWPALMQSGNPNSVSPNQAHEAGPKHDERVDNICQPKGRAIQVQDVIGERQPSVDVRRPRTQDSDVVIQITLEDPIEDTFAAGEKIDCRGSTLCEKYNNKENDENDNRVVLNCNGGEGDAFSVDSFEGNEKSVDRCSAEIIVSNSLTNDPNDIGKSQSPGVHGNHHKEMQAFSSDGTIELFDTVNKTMESVGLDADQRMMVAELSLEEESQLSLTSSCFGSDSEASEDNNYLSPGKVTSLAGRSSANFGTELRKSISSYRKILKGNHAKIKPVDFRDYSKCKSRAEEKQKHCIQRVDSPTQPNISIHDTDLSPRSDAGDVYDNYLSINSCRWKKKLQHIGYGSGEDRACYEESKLSHSYDDRKSSRNCINTAQKHYMKGRQDFNEERYRCEDEKRNEYWCRRGPFTRDMDPPAYKKFGQLVSRNSYTIKEMDPRSRRKINKFEFRKPTNHGFQYPDRKLDSDFMQERYARSVSFIDQKRDTSSGSYERQLPKRWKYLKKSGRNMYEDAFPLELEGSWSRETDDECWGNTDPYCFSHQSCTEFDERRWLESISPRNGFSHTRFIERYKRQLCARKGKDSSWFDSYYNSDEFENGFIFPADKVHFKRRCGWKSEVLPWTEEELIARHRDEKLHSEKASFLHKRDGRHRRNHSRRGSFPDAIHVDDMQSNQHDCKTIRDRNNTCCSYRSRKMYRGKNEQSFLRCRDSVDLTVGEGKLVTRYPNERSLRCNRRLEDTHLENAEERISLVDCNKSPSYEAVCSNLPKARHYHNNEKFYDQFSAALRNEDLDVEEGQIVTDEPCKRPSERMHNSASAARLHNPRKRMLRDDFVTSYGSKTRDAYDKQQILETLARMEKRIERFKEPITLKKEQDKCLDPNIVHVTVETPQVKQQRPVRKRQWCSLQGS